MIKLTGSILWFNERDGYGIINGDDGLEYYFDSSVWECTVSNPFKNRLVSFKLNTKIQDCRCATNISDYLNKNN